MPELTEAERDVVMNDFNGHYEEVLLLHAGFEIRPGFGLLQLRALGDDYIARRAAIEQIVQTAMVAKRAERDGLFGLSNEDLDGVWMYLLLYKANARTHLRRFAPKQAAKSLGSTTPNLGPVAPGTYALILTNFINHWELVNAAVPAANPLVLGPITLGELQSRRAQIEELAQGIDETVATRLAVMRAEKEQLFGDVREDLREDDSLVAYFEEYRTKVQTQFAGTPLSKTVPRIFPKQSESLPRFAFNFRQSAGEVVVWFVLPGSVTNASVVYLKEGAFEETRALPAAPPLKVTFSGVGVQDDVDEVELRDETGKTVAHGKFDSSLIEPV